MTDMTEQQETPTADGTEAPPAFPMSRAPGCPFGQPPELERLQAEQPVSKVRLWDGSTPWLITRHRDHQALLRDQRLSSDARLDGFPHTSPGAAERAAQTLNLANLDGAEHSRMRRAVGGPFTGGKVEARRSAIQRIVDERIDLIERGPRPADLVQELAQPVSTLVVCDILGAPSEDYAFFQRNSRVALDGASGAQQAGETHAQIVSYVDRLLAEKEKNPEDDLLSELAVSHIAAGSVTREEAAAAGALLLTGGDEATGSMIALGTLALLRHPDQLAELRASTDPKLVAGAVDELLRYLSVAQVGRRRVALADVEIGGQVIHAGEGVVVSGNAANRDPEVFADPDRLDIHRDARRQVAFGSGPHLCLAHALVRVILQVVFSTLFRRLPDLSLAVAFEDVRFKHGDGVYGVYELPVNW